MLSANNSAHTPAGAGSARVCCTSTKVRVFYYSDTRCELSTGQDREYEKGCSKPDHPELGDSWVMASCIASASLDDGNCPTVYIPQMLETVEEPEPEPEEERSLVLVGLLVGLGAAGCLVGLRVIAKRGWRSAILGEVKDLPEALAAPAPAPQKEVDPVKAAIFDMYRASPTGSSSYTMGAGKDDDDEGDEDGDGARPRHRLSSQSMPRLGSRSNWNDDDRKTRRKKVSIDMESHSMTSLPGAIEEEEEEDDDGDEEDGRKLRSKSERHSKKKRRNKLKSKSERPRTKVKEWMESQEEEGGSAGEGGIRSSSTRYISSRRLRSQSDQPGDGSSSDEDSRPSLRSQSERPHRRTDRKHAVQHRLREMKNLEAAKREHDGEVRSPHSHCRALFDRVDADGNGVLDREELAMLAQKMGKGLKESELDDAMRAIDRNQNGQIEFGEFCAFAGCFFIVLLAPARLTEGLADEWYTDEQQPKGRAEVKIVVSCHDIVGGWAAFFSRSQRYRC